jgi:plasmid stabilization system protein ParE
VTSYEVVISAAAEGDIEASFLWYRERNVLIADGFRAEVFDAIDTIAESPLSWPADEERNRHRVLHRFPYSVFYEVVEHTVTILAVAHHRRKPGYWTGGER